MLLSSPPSQCRKASGARGSPPSNKVWPGSTSVRQPPSRTRFGARSACWDITRPRRRGLSLFPAASGGLRGVEACCARQNLWLQPDIRDCPPRPASSTRFRSLGSSAWFSVSLQEPTSGLCALSAAGALGAAAGCCLLQDAGHGQQRLSHLRLVGLAAPTSAATSAAASAATPAATTATALAPAIRAVPLPVACTAATEAAAFAAAGLGLGSFGLGLGWGVALRRTSRPPAA